MQIDQLIEQIPGIALLLLIVGVIGFVVIRRVRRLRRDKQQSKDHIHDVVVEMEKHGKIRRGHGKYHPHNWAMKWVLYSKSIPISRQRYQMSGAELPACPRINEREAK